MSANATLLRVLALQDHSGGDNNTVFLEMSMPGDVHAERGAPLSLAVQIDCAAAEINDGSTGSWSMNYTLRWTNKTATHAPETLWLSSHSSLLAPDALDGASVVLSKLGQSVNALDADLGCSGERETCGVRRHIQ